MGALAARVHSAGRRTRTDASSASRLPADDEEMLVVHRGEAAFVLLNKFPYASGHLMVAPYRHAGDFAGLHRRRGARGAPARSPRDDGARHGDLRAGGLQRRLEPRPDRGRWDRRPCPPASRAPLVGRHELHARPGGREGAARAPGRDSREAGRGLAVPDALLQRFRE